MEEKVKEAFLERISELCIEKVKKDLYSSTRHMRFGPEIDEIKEIEDSAKYLAKKLAEEIFISLKGRI